MTKVSLRLAAIAGLAVLLSACGDKTKAPEQQPTGKAAEGDVLGGTISDDMIPLDELKSQSAPVKRSELPASEGGAPEATDSASPEADSTDAAPDASAEPAASQAAPSAEE